MKGTNNFIHKLYNLGSLLGAQRNLAPVKSMPSIFQDFLVVQWLGLCASTAGDASLIPGWRAKVPHAMWHGQNIFLNAHCT